MPGKAMKCVVEIDVHVVTCPGTFLKDYEYVYLNVEMLGLEARTKSVPPTFPLFFHERLKFERTFYDCTDPSLVAALLKGEDVIVELRQHTDYISDGKVISHCSSNTHDFLFPAIPQYYGPGREILLYKTARFKPIRITGEPVKMEFSSKTAISEISDLYSTSGASLRRSISRSRSVSPVRLSRSMSSSELKTADHDSSFLVKRKDDKSLQNRDFSSFIRPKPRRSKSPTRTRRAVSPNASFGLGSATVEPLPSWKYSTDFPSSTLRSTAKHTRSRTTPIRSASPTRSLRYALDDLHLKDTLQPSKTYADPVLRYKARYSPNLKAALGASDRIQRRVEELVKRKDYSLDSDENLSDESLDVLRDSLREERKALSEAIREADREAFYRSVR
ncbi:spermatogenesis-associated protein 6-like isoform X1 [Rhopilema esculentum]|uniref:spermatogenesis-associated protein 6-like isoform X1 n=1 Tax=Rhopilema esculentum TaxID=499914 RepID=UPI0031DDDDB2